MKKISLFFGLLIGSVTVLTAQNVTDGLRYGMEDLTGTARYVSMGGAFGALGGDMSALNVNPAGSAVFNNNHASISMDINTFNNATKYGNEKNKYRNNKFDINQAGAVFVFNNNDESAAVSRLSFGVGYNRQSNFKNIYKAIGRSNETQGDYFLEAAQGIKLENLEASDNQSLSDKYASFGNDMDQTAYLGYEGYLFDPQSNDANNTAYIPNYLGSAYDHHYRMGERGVNGKLSFNGSFAVKDQFLFGLNLNSHFVDFRQNTFMSEYVVDPQGDIDEIHYGNYLDVTGSGFSFQLGGIAKVNDMIRVGASYESPTWYTISEETNEYLGTVSYEEGDAVASPNVTNVYPDYKLRTPGKWNGSVAAVFDSGLISVDYSYKDFANTKFTSSAFDHVNSNIKGGLQGVHSARIGGEYLIKNLSLRAGFRYEQTPYKDKSIGDLQGYSAGLGYNFGATRIDLAYDFAKRDYKNDLLYTGFSEGAAVKNEVSQIILTLAFSL